MPSSPGIYNEAQFSSVAPCLKEAANQTKVELNTASRWNETETQRGKICLEDLRLAADKLGFKD